MEASIRTPSGSPCERRLNSVSEIGAFLGTRVLGFSNIRLKTWRDCGRVQDKTSCARGVPAAGYPAEVQGQSMPHGCILAKTVRAKRWGSVGSAPTTHVRLIVCRAARKLHRCKRQLPRNLEGDVDRQGCRSAANGWTHGKPGS